MPRRAIAELHGSHMFNFKRKGPFSSPTSNIGVTPFLCVFFSIWNGPSSWFVAIQMGVFVLLCPCGLNLNPLMANNVQHLPMCLLVICTSSSVKCLFLPFVHFLIGLLVSYCWGLRLLQNSLDGSTLSDTWFANMFSLAITCLFILFM